MKRLFNITIAFVVLMLTTNSCMKDLDTVPIDPDQVTSVELFENPESYKHVLAKLYAGLAVSGQTGPHGNSDISGLDEGYGQYLRALWHHQELTTDEAVISWNDQTIKDYHWQTWGTTDVFIANFYYRVFYQISAVNEFIRETSESNLDERGVSGQLRTDIGYFRAEARWLRALSYWHAMDNYANVPFVTDSDPVGAFFPEQISRSDLFNYIEGELVAIEPLMMDSRSNEYARADKAAVWMLLAKLYQNAEVYTGIEKYTDCITYCKKIIEAGYSLEVDYSHLFLADNYLANNEIIFTVAYDGVFTRTWGGTTAIIHAGVGGEMEPLDYGVDGGWGGTRTTSALVNKFEDITGETDQRAMFFTEGQSLEINDISLFTDGYAIIKFKNLDRDGNVGSDLTHVDTDFPMFRLADVYLMYAEAVLRGGQGGDVGEALNFVNLVRKRAYGGNSNGEITSGELTLDFIIDERARELYWEGHRRTDLIRYNLFTGGAYLWPWKGNLKEGRATDSKFNLFPIPDSDIGANPNLVQNPGY
jgi:hypothetical protein